MAKKKTQPSQPTRPLNFRVSEELHERLEETARLLGTDVSHLVRMLIVENLRVYEERARLAHGKH